MRAFASSLAQRPERLTLPFPFLVSRESLQQWISEIKGLILVKRAEMRGIGNAARALKDRGPSLPSPRSERTRPR